MNAKIAAAAWVWDVMDIRQLKYFIKAAEFSHFTRAAEALYVSQPALSAQIRQLEEDLGIELFARVGRNVRLTDAGEAFLLRAKQAVDAVEQGEEEVGAIKGLLKGKLRICAVPAVAAKVLTPMISVFQQTYPDVYVQLFSNTSDLVERGVVDGKYCLGLTTMPLEYDELKYYESVTGEVVVVMNHDHPLAKKNNIRPTDLTDLPMVLASQQIMTWRGIAYFEDHNVTLKVMTEAEELDSVFSLVRQNSYISLAPSPLVPPDLLGVPLSPAPPLLQLAFVWSRLSTATNKFLKLAQDKQA
ncbi:MAG: LysR family transcriptional regulator [Cyanobacteria bacterium]|nr:LysR family transcriptional regulator [Cyanobacteriota bacterium]